MPNPAEYLRNLRIKYNIPVDGGTLPGVIVAGKFRNPKDRENYNLWIKDRRVNVDGEDLMLHLPEDAEKYRKAFPIILSISQEEGLSIATPHGRKLINNSELKDLMDQGYEIRYVYREPDKELKYLPEK